jgi:hypothetical protein
MKKILPLILLIGIIQSSCSTPLPTSVIPGQPSVSPTPDKIDPGKAYPSIPPKGIATPGLIPTLSYPAPTGKPIQLPTITQGSKPTEGVIKGPVFLDKLEIILSGTVPGRYKLNITGSRPTPCHELQYQVNDPDRDKKIVVEVFSLVKAGQICAQVLSPFSVSIDLGNIPGGVYTVFANDMKAGELRIP